MPSNCCAMAARRSLARVAGLDVDLLSRLEGQNFRTAEDVLTRSSLDLVEMLDVSLPTAQRVAACVARSVCPRPCTARALLMARGAPEGRERERERGGGGGGGGGGGVRVDAPARVGSGAAAATSSHQPTQAGSHQVRAPAYVASHLPALDKALGGGVPTGSINELVGPAGAGKTQMCLTLAVATAAPTNAGGLGAGVVYIDTEQKFSGARLAEIARAKFPDVYGADASFDDAQAALERLTAKVLVLTPSTLSEILQRLNGLEEALIDHGVRLLVVDSMACLARAEFGRGQVAQRQELLGQIASVLKQQAERLHMAVFVTNQVTTRIGAPATHGARQEGSGRDGDGDGGEGGSVTAALGTKWAHCVNTRLVLEGSGPTESAPSHRAGSFGRVVKVVKSPRCPLVGFEYEVWAGGIRVDGEKKVTVHPSAANVDAGIRGVFGGSVL